jgi:hypothetical protein
MVNPEDVRKLVSYARSRGLQSGDNDIREAVFYAADIAADSASNTGITAEIRFLLAIGWSVRKVNGLIEEYGYSSDVP